MEPRGTGQRQSSRILSHPKTSRTGTGGRTKGVGIIEESAGPGRGARGPVQDPFNSAAHSEEKLGSFRRPSEKIKKILNLKSKGVLLVRRDLAQRGGREGLNHLLKKNARIQGSSRKGRRGDFHKPQSRGRNPREKLRPS